MKLQKIITDFFWSAKNVRVTQFSDCLHLILTFCQPMYTCTVWAFYKKCIDKSLNINPIIEFLRKCSKHVSRVAPEWKFRQYMPLPRTWALLKTVSQYSLFSSERLIRHPRLSVHCNIKINNHCKNSQPLESYDIINSLCFCFGTLKAYEQQAKANFFVFLWCFSLSLSLLQGVNGKWSHRKTTESLAWRNKTEFKVKAYLTISND